MTGAIFPLRLLCLALCLALCLFFTGCTAKSNATAHALVLAAANTESALPAGDIYVLPASHSLRALNTDAPLNTSVREADTPLLSAAFGAGGGTQLPAALDGMADDGAMRFSTAASPCEFIVLHCVSRTDTAAVATLLHGRLDILRRQYRGTDHEALLERAEVVVIGKYVLLLVCSDAENALREIRRVLR